MKILALLPMKGNSERIPNKNLRNFAGKPLYHRILQTLLSSKYINNVIVNTDSDAIKLDILNHFDSRVIIIDRPKNICGDFVSMNKVIECDIKVFDADFYFQTHSTNPLLSIKSIDDAIENMMLFYKESKHDSIFSVTKLQTRLYSVDCSPLNHDPNSLMRTQDLDPLFEENSCFYLFSKDSFYNSGGKRIGLNPFMFELNKIESIDIDEKEDFLLAEAMYNKLL
ncbi:MAG: hypothetical protein RL567_1208 [Bacteroidota bacterium]|jgi:CMP-N-acetylneuraminic acid synthetase